MNTSNFVTARAIFHSQSRASLVEKPRIFFNRLFGYWKVTCPFGKAEVYCQSFRVACKMARNMRGIDARPK